MGDLFNNLFEMVAKSIVGLHKLTGPVFGEDSGVSWALAIVLLTVIVRLLMYPLFVKQIKTQRAMTALQPKIKELQTKHKGDKETLNTELMKLYKEHNANPFAGCLPVLLQMPIFIALYQALTKLKPEFKDGVYNYKDEFGLGLDTVQSFTRAKIFGAPIGAGFNSNDGLLAFLGAEPGPVKILAVTLIVAMALTTFLTSRQMMGRNPNADASQATQQKVLLYLMPALLAVFGFQVAIGVLVYWTTTNLFSMAQQAVVIRHLGPPEAQLAAGKATAAGKKPAVTKPAGKPAQASAITPQTEGSTEDAKPAPPKRPVNRNAKNRGKGQRRGGRR